MDTSHSFSKSELSFLWNRESKRYTIESFTENGHWITHLVLNDNSAGGKVIGKLVKRSSEEFRQRPWLHHRNLASLIDMVTIHDDLTVFISVYQKKSLREMVHDKPFHQSSNCFALKKIYIEDVLWGLDYLHRNGLCLMNLTDANVFICEQPNKAIITDFGCLTQVNKEDCKFAVPFIHQPPEIRMDGTQCNLIAAEMWVAGMMALEIFTQHQLPWALVNYDPDRAHEMIAKIDYDILKVANKGSTLSIQDLSEFKIFVGLFIDENPQQRCSARDAVSTAFLQSPKYSVSLQRSEIHSNNGSEKNESVSFPSFHQLAYNYKQNCKSNNDIRTLKTIKTHLDANKTVKKEKSKSNSSFKECVYSVKKINSDMQSHDIQQPNYVNFDNDAVSDSSNNVDKVNSESKYILNIDSMSQENIYVNDIKPLSKTKSKTLLSSQIDRMSCTSENPDIESKLKNNMPTSECSNKSQNEGIDFIPMSRPFVTYNFSPTTIREKSASTKMVSPAMENNQKNVCGPCKIDICVSSNHKYDDCYRQTKSDNFYANKMLPKDSTRNTIDDFNRKWESLVDVNNSLQKERIPVSKNYPETYRLNTKIVSKNPYTLSESQFSSLQKSTAFNVPDSIAEAKNIINIELKKEIDQEMFIQSEKIKGQNSPLANNIKTQNIPVSEFTRSNQPSSNASKFVLEKNPYVHTQNMPISGFKYSNQPPANASTFVMKKIPYVQPHVKNVTNCSVQREYSCPRHQREKLLDKNIHQETNFLKNKKEYTSQNKCKTCGNISIKPKVSDKNSENTLTFPNGCSTDEYWFPARTLYDQRKSPILSPSPLSQISGKDAKQSACETPRRPSYEQAIWKREDLHKNNNIVKDTEEVPVKEDQLQKVVVICSPRMKGFFKDEQEHTKRGKYKKKNVKKDALKKYKKSGKKFENPYASTECMVVENNSDEKQSKKMKRLKKCFCIGK